MVPLRQIGVNDGGNAIRFGLWVMGTRHPQEND